MKNNSLQRFTTTELQDLDAFLRSHTSKMSVVKAHGFITAIVSFPDLFLPSEWIPILVGELKLKPDCKQNKLMLDRLITMYRQVSDSLSSNRSFEFLLSADQPYLNLENAAYSSIQEWCNGYCLALVWNEEEWLNVPEEYITHACATFFMLTDLMQSNKQYASITAKEDKHKLINNLPELVKALYVYWLGKQDDLFNFIPPRSQQNTPCTCGSNKLYYSCCWLEVVDSVIH